MIKLHDRRQQFETLAHGLRFPEGPIWCRDGSIILVEIAAGCLSRVNPNGIKSTIAQLGGGPNGAAIGPDGYCYVCNNGGFAWHEDEAGLRPVGQSSDYSGGRIERIDLATGAVHTLYTESDRAPLRGPNDIVFDAHGGFWFTDAGKARSRDMDRSSVCYAHADGSKITEVIQPMLTANGIGLSPKGDRLYVAETQSGRLWGFDISGPGQIARRPWPSPNGGELIANLGGYSLCDSLAVDASGWIWIATLFNGGLSVVSPDGTDIRHIPLPDLYTTNICFGGPDMQTAFVTLSQSGRLIAFRTDRPGLPLNH